METLNKRELLNNNQTILKSKKILKCLNIVLEQEKISRVESLIISRLETLIRSIYTKTKNYELSINKRYTKEKIYELELQLGKYIKEAKSLIKEKMTTGRITNYFDYSELELT